MSDFTSSSNRILLIDDDSGLRTLVLTMLTRIGLQGWTAETGIEGMEMLKTEDFGLLILDLMLPDMDGFQVLEKLRKDNRYDQLPVLILSARADTEAITRALSMGADGYLTKPYITNSLTERVKALLASGRKKPESN